MDLGHVWRAKLRCVIGIDGPPAKYDVSPARQTMEEFGWVLRELHTPQYETSLVAKHIYLHLVRRASSAVAIIGFKVSTRLDSSSVV